VIIPSVNQQGPLITGTYAYWRPPGNVIVRDVTTGELLAPIMDSGGDTWLWKSLDNGITWTQVAGTSVSYPNYLLSTIQDASGYWHILMVYGGGVGYARVTLTRTGNAVTSWSWDPVMYLPAMPGSPTEAYGGHINIARNGFGIDQLVVSGVAGTSPIWYACVIRSSLTPTTTEEWLALDGTASSWTALQSQTQASTTEAQFAPYGFQAQVQPYGSSGNLYVASGPYGKNDTVDYGTPVYGQRLLASGANWTVDAAVDTISGLSYESMLGTSCNVGGSAYFAVSYGVTDVSGGDLRVARVSSLGTLTGSIAPFLAYGSACTEPYLLLWVDSSERIILIECPIDYAATGYSNTTTLAHYYNGAGTWTSYQFRGVNFKGVRIDVGCGSTGWTSGFAVMTSSQVNDQVQFGSVILVDVEAPSPVSVLPSRSPGWVNTFGGGSRADTGQLTRGSSLLRNPRVNCTSATLIGSTFWEATATALLVKRWDGSGWVDAPVNVWNGSGWVTVSVSRWTGSSWS
jgi:hypothetical protein